jgi:serine/arginine repetitive matrix protein 1
MASSIDAKLLKQTKFPPEFNRKVDMKKVNIEVMKKWIAGKISEILGNEDDVVIELCFNLLEGSRFVCPFGACSGGPEQFTDWFRYLL